jgi:hypothetical protein
MMANSQRSSFEIHPGNMYYWHKFISIIDLSGDFACTLRSKTSLDAKEMLILDTYTNVLFLSSMNNQV